LFFIGQGVSLTGNWMTTTASAWLAYELSGSPFVVGLLAFTSHIPILLFSSLAGVWSDRLNRHRLIMLLQVFCFLVAALLAGITLTGHVTVAWLLVLSTVRGLINAVEFPTRQAFIVELIETKKDLGNAIALNSTLFNLARLTGPSVAGWVIVAGGAGGCYLLDALSYAPILISLSIMKLPRRVAAPPKANPWEELRAGWRYAAATPTLRAPLILVAVMSMVAFSAATLAPVFARDVFLRDARTLGLMFAAVGAGALGSALFLSSRTSAVGLTRWVARGVFMVGVGQTAFAASPWLSLALLSLTLTGAGIVLTMAGSNTLIQSSVDDDKRGRVMGLFSMGQGMFPIGSLIVGFAASVAGPRPAVFASAAVCLLAAVLFHRTVRRSLDPMKPNVPTSSIQDA
jgi:MFS family permease